MKNEIIKKHELYNQADIFINRAIGDGKNEISAAQFKQELSAIPADAELNIFFDSNGGGVSDGREIYKAIRNHKGKTTSHIQGLAASISSVIALACDEIFIAADALLMIHDPHWSVSRSESRCSMPGHNYIKIPRLQKLIEIPTLQKNNSKHSIEMMKRSVKKHRNTSAERRRLLETDKEFILDVYVLRSGANREDLREMMAEETWLTASDAVQFGFADFITSPAGLIDHHDLSQFSNPNNFLSCKYSLSAQTARGKRKTKVNRKQMAHMAKTVNKIRKQHNEARNELKPF